MASSKQLEYLVVGRIGAAHGLGGEIRVQPQTNDPARFQDLKDCFLVSQDEKTRRPVTIQTVRQSPGHVLVKLLGVDDRTGAELLRGSFLAVSRLQAVALRPGEWFICDLIGCMVHDDHHGHLGLLTDVLQPASQDVYVIHQDGLPDLMLPALKSVLVKVDIEQKRIDVHLPDGLYEIYRQDSP